MNLSENWEGEAPAEPQTSENVIFNAAQQELRPPGEPICLVLGQILISSAVIRLLLAALWLQS